MARGERIPRLDDTPVDGDLKFVTTGQEAVKGRREVPFHPRGHLEKPALSPMVMQVGRSDEPVQL